MNLKKFIPYDCKKTVYDIDYQQLYDEGRRVILLDIDNTLVPHDVKLPDEKLKILINSILEIGFKIIFISNNHKKRVKLFADAFNLPFVNSAKKPFKGGYKKAIKLSGETNLKKIISIGDQVMTDVYGCNRIGIDVILVDTLKLINERWYTKLNRKIEARLIKRLKKNHYEDYLKIKEIKDL